MRQVNDVSECIIPDAGDRIGNTFILNGGGYLQCPRGRGGAVSDRDFILHHLVDKKSLDPGSRRNDQGQGKGQSREAGPAKEILPSRRKKMKNRFHDAPALPHCRRQGKLWDRGGVIAAPIRVDWV